MLHLALSVVRCWTTLYTSGMPDGLREARRAEIASDLWESQHDGGNRSELMIAAHVLLRLARGIPDDLLWRLELIDLRSKRRRTGVWVTATAGIVLSVAFWVAGAMGPITLPNPPGQMAFVAIGPPPPPPPYGPARVTIPKTAPPPPPAPPRAASGVVPGVRLR